MNWSDYFYYDETSPTCLRWKVAVANSTHNVVNKGDIAGCRAHNERGKPKAIYVRFKGRNYRGHKIVWELYHPEICKDEVIDHLNGDPFDNRIENLEPKTQKQNSRNRIKSPLNKSGVTGVYFYINCVGTRYYAATWRDKDGKAKAKSFSFKIYGEDAAFKMACEFRRQKIEELNHNGAGYTERHGK